MTFLNDYEAQDAYRIFSENADSLGNLLVGTGIVLALIDWTNDNSDGWAYWLKPRRAADRMCTLIEDRRREYLRGHPVADIHNDEFTAALRPIKNFLTKQGVDYNAELPWAAILPVAS